MLKLKPGWTLMDQASKREIVPGSTTGTWVTPRSHSPVLAESSELVSSTALKVVETLPAPSNKPNAWQAATVVMACTAPVPKGSLLETRLAEGGGNLNINTDKPSLADHQVGCVLCVV